MIDPSRRSDAGGDTLDRDTFDALRSMLATMLGGASLVSGQLERVPAVGEVGRAVVMLRQSLALNVAATGTQARTGVAFARTVGRSASVAYALGRNTPRLARAARRR
ncbi:MAG TPA: hypothetical protein VFW14_05580 [Gaiellales bacterium]|jgi:hypothetical protein|nr:hypothetical protein [Gaiellales bacterium]